MSQGSFITKERESFTDAVIVSGMKKHPSDSTQNSRYRSTCASSTNGHLVYVRRKFEEPGKRSSHFFDPTISVVSRQIYNSEQKGLNRLQDDDHEAKAAVFPVSSPVSTSFTIIPSQDPEVPSTVGRSSNSSPANPNVPMSSVAVTDQPSCVGSCNAHWKERFSRLQMFLNKCDQSSPEEYIQMLRSLTAVGRSKHAVELEKRAIHLFLEEGKELSRMKLLNVLGAASPN